MNNKMSIVIVCLGLFLSTEVLSAVRSTYRPPSKTYNQRNTYNQSSRNTYNQPSRNTYGNSYGSRYGNLSPRPHNSTQKLASIKSLSSQVTKPTFSSNANLSSKNVNLKSQLARLNSQGQVTNPNWKKYYDHNMENKYKQHSSGGSDGGSFEGNQLSKVFNEAAKPVPTASAESEAGNSSTTNETESQDLVLKPQLKYQDPGF